ncbi:MAG: hypothetical protein HY735_26610 [Verrucomicrobia bacterium]|nr:hypothetical protein [Verrucomicrobiota bacterium]
MTDAITLSMPQLGSHQLRILSPTVLELVLINAKAPDPSRVARWDFVDANGQFNPPASSEFVVLADGQAMGVQSVGFKRRPLYAPIRQRDLRIADHLYLKLASPIATDRTVVVQNPSQRLWPTHWQFVAKADPLRYSPAIHVNQVGYLPQFSKTGLVGYYLGNLGELTIDQASAFQLIDHRTGGIVFESMLTRREDKGYQYTPPPSNSHYDPYVVPALAGPREKTG